MLFPGRAKRDVQKRAGGPVRAGGLLTEGSRPRRGGGEEVTNETAYQGGHLQMHAP